MEVWKRLIPVGKSAGVILDKVLLDGHLVGEEILLDIKGYRKAEEKNDDRKKRKKSTS